MKAARYSLPLWIPILGLVLWREQASAFDERPSWEERVFRADFAGILRCEVAGWRYARYRVEESWKGAPKESLLTLRFEEDYGLWSLPRIQMCGERAVVILKRRHRAPNVFSEAVEATHPIAWREVDEDLTVVITIERVPLGPVRGSYTWKKMTWGYVELREDRTDGGAMDLSAVGHVKGSLEELRRDVVDFAARSAGDQELRVLRAALDRALPEFDPKQPSPGGFSRAWVPSARKTLHQARTAPEFILRLVAFKESDPHWSEVVQTVLERGGPITVQLVKRIPTAEWLDQGASRAEIIRRLEERAVEVAKAKVARSDLGGKPTEREMIDARERLLDAAEAEFGSDWERAFCLLVKHEPAFVADFLAGWPDTSRSGWDAAPYDYRIASHFASRCGSDRAENLRTLTRAKAPWIRAAGAVYLCYEDLEAGMAELARLADLPEEPGIWIGLTRARRGVKEGADRALASFDLRGGVNEFAADFVALLSNSAHASRLPQPDPPDLRTWWQTYREQITLSDPWLPELAKLKID